MANKKKTILNKTPLFKTGCGILKLIPTMYVTFVFHQAHVDVIEKHLCNKAEVRRQMSLLKLVSFLVPFLMGLRRKNKVPDMSRLLPQLTGNYHIFYWWCHDLVDKLLHHEPQGTLFKFLPRL